MWPDQTEVLSERLETLDRLTRRIWDVLVVGGGITGAAIARAAAREGLAVALVDQGDFAGGTSGRSSRLIHGGLRYLKQGRVGFVRKCIREQGRLAVAAPHLIRPFRFLMPLYRDDRYPPWAMRGFLSGFRAVHPREHPLPYEELSAAETLGREPLLRERGLACGVSYGEYLTHDARLVLENVIDARGSGATVLNHVRVEWLADGDGIRAGLRDGISGLELEIGARVAVDATGPWSDGRLAGSPDRRLRLSKGVHLVIARDRLPLRGSVVLFSPRDGRAVFAIPRARFVIVGTTETEYEGDPREATPDPEDRDYLLETLDRALEESPRPADVIHAWAGVRPLCDASGRPAGRLSRDYVIGWESERILSVLGGKLSLHRDVAERAMRAILPARGRNPDRCTDDAPLPGARWPLPGSQIEDSLTALGVDAASARRLVRVYGGRSSLLAGWIREDPGEAVRLDPRFPYVRAEAGFAIADEMAVHAEDFVERRTDFGLELRAAGSEIPTTVREDWPLDETVCRERPELARDPEGHKIAS